AGRALMLPDEIRQMPKFRQLLVVTDTAPPVKAAFPPVYLRKDIQKPTLYRKPEVLRFSDAQIFGGNFSKAKNANNSIDAAKTKKSSKGKRAKNQLAKALAENNVFSQTSNDLSVPSENEFETRSFEKADTVLDEIGELLMDYETDNTNQVNVLALANDVQFDEAEKDFMQQKIYKILTGENPKAQFVADRADEEIQDCFDKEFILQPQISPSSADILEGKQEIILSADFHLTEAEMIREKESVRRIRKTENEFSNTLARGVL
ncbi:MAG: hypothetical protein ABJA66_21710, partial [Actinomycetota bacterium]